MRRSAIRRKMLNEQGGFTLVEVLVTMLMMVTVMFALYSIFDMSLRVFSFGNDKVEAVENARLGMERMEREIRAAYPYDKADEVDPDDTLLATHESDEITFGNDTNGNREIDGGEEITYSLVGSTLQRDGDPVAESIQTDGLEFEYLEGDGTTTAIEEDTDIVSITLIVDVDGRTQTLNTDVALRNRSE